MAFDAHPSLTEARPATTPSTAAGRERGRAAPPRPVRAAVRRRCDEAALAAAIRELRTQRHARDRG